MNLLRGNPEASEHRKLFIRKRIYPLISYI